MSFAGRGQHPSGFIAASGCPDGSSVRKTTRAFFLIPHMNEARRGRPPRPSLFPHGLYDRSGFFRTMPTEPQPLGERRVRAEMRPRRLSGVSARPADVKGA